jgi:hypothetical protein
MRAQGADDAAQDRALPRNGTLDRGLGRGRRMNPLRRGDDDRRRRFPPYREIGAGIAGIDKALDAETLDEGRGFRRAAEIVAAVRGDHFIEEAEMIGDLLGDPAIGRGREHEPATQRFLLLEIGEKFEVVGKLRRLEIPAPRQLFLEPRLALGEPARQPQDNPWIGQASRDRRLLQRVGDQ